MLEIVSHEVTQRESKEERYTFIFQIELPANDIALTEGGTELMVIFNNQKREIEDYAFVSKKNSNQSDLNASLSEKEQNLVVDYCNHVLNS